MTELQKKYQYKTQLLNEIHNKRDDLISLEKTLKALNVDIYLIETEKQGELLL
jgi:hypothetical protein